MNDDEYLKLVKETWLKGPDCGKPILYCMVGLAGEVGEIANMAQKSLRGDFDSESLGPTEYYHNLPKRKVQRQKLLEEMGGVFWYLHALCWRLGVDPGEVRALNAKKLRSRLERGTIRGSGDDR